MCVRILFVKIVVWNNPCFFFFFFSRNCHMVEVTGDCDEDSQVFSLDSSYVGVGAYLLYTRSYVSAGYT